MKISLNTYSRTHIEQYALLWLTSLRSHCTIIVIIFYNCILSNLFAQFDAIQINFDKLNNFQYCKYFKCYMLMLKYFKSYQQH